MSLSVMAGATSLDGCNFPEMPQSMLALLHTSSRSPRSHAHPAPLGSLSAYNDPPKGHTWAEIWQELTGCIRRDVRSKRGGEGTLDTQLATQSLKLPTILPCTPATAAILPDDRCISSPRVISSKTSPSTPSIGRNQARGFVKNAHTATMITDINPLDPRTIPRPASTRGRHKQERSTRTRPAEVQTRQVGEDRPHIVGER